MFLSWRWPFKSLLIGVLSLICFGLCMGLGYSFHLSFSMALLCSLACFIIVHSMEEISLEGDERDGTDRSRGSWMPRLLVSFLHFMLLVGVVAGIFVPGSDLHPVFLVLVIAASAFVTWLMLARFRPWEGMMRTLLLLILLGLVLVSCAGPSFPVVPPRTPVGAALPDLGPQPGICGRTPEVQVPSSGR